MPLGLLWDAASREQAEAAAAVAPRLGFEPRLLELAGQPPDYSAALMAMDASPGEPVMIPASPDRPNFQTPGRELAAQMYATAPRALSAFGTGLVSFRFRPMPGATRNVCRKNDDASGDFTWKDPAAAEHFGLPLDRYVIVGMDPDFRELIYAAGRSMDAKSPAILTPHGGEWMLRRSCGFWSGSDANLRRAATASTL